MKYFFSNKGKSVSVIFIVVLSIFAVYFVSSLVQAVFKTGEDSNINALSQFSIIATKGNAIGIKDEMWNDISSHETVDCIYNTYLEQTYISNILGNTTSFILFTSENDLNTLFEKCGFQLSEGRMPFASRYELIMHENILKNKELAIGDKFEASSGTYIIVGSYTGNCLLTLGIKNHAIEQYIDLGADISDIHFAGIVFPSSNMESMNNMLDDINDSDVECITASDIKKQFEDQLKNFTIILSIIVIVVISSISAAIGVVLSTLYSGRIDEFGILSAIGYSKKRIISKYVLKEISLLIIFSWILGMIVSFIVLNFIDRKIFVPMGQTIPIFNAQSVFFTCSSLVLILIIAVVPIIVKLSNTDLISVIERR